MRRRAWSRRHFAHGTRAVEGTGYIKPVCPTRKSVSIVLRRTRSLARRIV
nr:orf 5' to immediate early 0 orf [Autographa californica nucleopolyhedrovirus]